MPTDWDASYRAGQTPWEKGRAAPPLLEWLEKSGHRFSGDVLVPGCGFGHDVRAIAATGQAQRIVGLDLSGTAVEQARQYPAVGSEVYEKADLFALPRDFQKRFDWVFEHTCFCAIDPARRADYVRAVAEALCPGGHLLAIFYLRPYAGGEILPLGGGPPFGTTIEELDSLFVECFCLVESWEPTRSFPGREGRETVRLLKREAQIGQAGPSQNDQEKESG